MGDSSKYRVIISGKVIAEYDRMKVLENLAAVFNSRISVIEKLLQGKETALVKAYYEAEATAICQKIRHAGAECSISEVEAVSLEKEESVDTYAQSGSSEIENKEERLLNTEAPLEGDPDSNNSSADARSETKQLESLMMRFVRINTDYYRYQFQKFGNPESPSFKFSWHWPAFFSFCFWALYRKMWAWAAINMLGGIALVLWFKPGLIYLVWVFLWSSTANYLYFRRVTKLTRNALINNLPEEHFLHERDVSKSSIWIGILITLLLLVLFSHSVTIDFLEKYGDQIQDVLPGSGTQIRGDGSPLNNIEKSAKESKTSFILSGLGTSLKILLVVDEGDNNKQTIANYVNRISNGLAKDAWDTQIQVEQHVDRYMFVSAGPDKTFNTDDDILQPVIIP